MAIRQKISFTFNGIPQELFVDPGMRMLDVIREILDQTGTKEGCGIGSCGACTVLVNRSPVNSCLFPAGQMHRTEILTIEGLDNDAMAEVIRKCFIEEGAVQCGYCTPGMVLSAYALLSKKSNPANDEIRVALSGNLCRCTGYLPIIRAVEKAGERLSEPSKSLDAEFGN